MEHIATSAAELELYKDMVKIGIPAIAGIAAGLIPYALEKIKIKNTEYKDQQDFKNNQAVELVNSLSEFSGVLSSYISILGSTHIDNSDHFKVFSKKGMEEFNSSYKLLAKSKAIAGLLGQHDLVTKIESYHKLVVPLIDAFNPMNHADDKVKNEWMGMCAEMEVELFKGLSVLTEANPNP